MGHRHTVRLLVLAACAAVPGSAAMAQWEWTHSASSATFPSKDAALNDLHAQSSLHSKLTQERTAGIAGSIATYEYTAPMVEPDIGDWYYATQHAPGLSFPRF